MNPMDLLPDEWALITGVLSTFGAVAVGAFWAGHKLGVQGKTTLKETHAAHIDLLRDRFAFADAKAEYFLRQKDELERKIAANASKEELTIAVQKVDAAATEWATANAAVGSSLAAAVGTAVGSSLAAAVGSTKPASGTDGPEATSKSN